MKLIGQFDSPFVRRVGIALEWYGLPFTHLPLSVFGDAEALAVYNPLRRVPTLVLDDGMILTEALVCLEALDATSAKVHGRDWDRLLAPLGLPRLPVLQRAALAGGAADKVVSLVYEERIREARSARWTERCTTQVVDSLARLELDTPDAPPQRLTHADIALTCLLTFIMEAQPALLSRVTLPKLRALQAYCEQLPEFRRVFAPFAVATSPRATS